MKFQVRREDPLDYACPVLVLCCFEEKSDEPLLGRFDQALGGTLRAMFQDKEFTGALNRTALVRTLGRVAPERLLLVGLGKEKDFTPERMRQAGGTAAQALRSSSVRTAAFFVPEGDAVLRAAMEGFGLGAYSFDCYKTTPEQGPAIEAVDLLVVEGSPAGDAERIAAEVLRLCEAVRFSRDLVSQPGNVATPAFLAEKALE
ncbi:MAG: leucyl aminopeptidase, partial [Deltaproteobacteria bacterium]|nr:leucyl aminopeptidase [Deltaproteobacteria bacterium]